MDNLDFERLRIAFVVYGGMNRKDWRTVNIEDVGFDVREFDSQLLPTLRNAAEIDVGNTDGGGGRRHVRSVVPGAQRRASESSKRLPAAAF